MSSSARHAAVIGAYRVYWGKPKPFRSAYSIWKHHLTLEGSSSDQHINIITPFRAVVGQTDTHSVCTACRFVNVQLAVASMLRGYPGYPLFRT